MPKGIWRLTVARQFSAAHQLRNYGGKCERMHGHNFKVEVEVEGHELDPKIHYLMDFGDLKKLTDKVLSELDHCHLNEHPFFSERNPSSENLALFIHGRVAAELPDHVSMHSVTVTEKEGQKASYMEA